MNDLISRSALLEVTPEAVADEESNQNEIAYAEGWNDCLESFCSIVKYAPAVDAEVVRHGHWIVYTNWTGSFGQVYSKCSECGTVYPGKQGSRGDGKGGKFCEECGAMMDGDVNA